MSASAKREEPDSVSYVSYEDMRIRLTNSVYGAWTGKPGDEVDRPDAEARKLINHGAAVDVTTAEQTSQTPGPDQPGSQE